MQDDKIPTSAYFGAAAFVAALYLSFVGLAAVIQ
jgi:hypothetical protein